jgi:acetyl esterase/lipase
MMKLHYLILLLFANVLHSQIPYKTDTSYTVQSTYNKEKIKFPFIKIVKERQHKRVKHIQDLVYKKTDTRELHLDAYFNKGNSLKPAVVLIHGGGWKSGNKSQMKFLAQEIASRGYSCFAVEYRLSPEAAYPVAIYDVKEAIKYIKANAKNFNADPSRFAVLGCSSGGQMAALIGTTNYNLEFEDQKSNFNQNANVQAIIDMDGILAFKHPESQEGKVAGEWLGGTFEEKPDIWKHASALTHTAKNTPPVLFINSDMVRFHAGREDMIAILKQNGIYNETKEIPNSPHSFWFFHPWFEKIVTDTTDFLDRILK